MRVAFCLYALMVAAMLGATCRAGTIYDSGGFEQPRFTAGSLVGQDGGVWVEAGSGATATVQSGVVATGKQAVQVTRTSGDDRFLPFPATTPVVQRFVFIDWDMNVLRTNIDTVSFGPFFGIEAYSPATKVLGAAGVDATTGDLLYEAPNTGILTETGTKVAFRQFNHYQLVIDNSAKNFSIYLNHALVKKTGGFVNSSASGFSDADISALAADIEPPTEPGTAYFDNYAVRTSNTGPASGAVPLPRAFWSGLIMLAVVGLVARRFGKIGFA